MSNEITTIAEIGSNHAGSLDLALAHIQGAKASGATGVKFQLFRAETLDARPEVQARLKPYEIPLHTHASSAEKNWVPKLSAYAHELELQFGVTPFAVDLVAPLRGLVDFVKISAYDLTFDDLISAAAGLGVPVVLSTAMATHEEIFHAASLCFGRDVTVLQGVAQYPARLEDQNLGIFHTWGRRYGLSDHTSGHEAAMLAVALGATWIEKHFRLDGWHFDTTRWGVTGLEFQGNPDYTVSSTPRLFREMQSACVRTLQALGTGEKNGPLACEQELFATCRRTHHKPLRG